MHRDLDVSMNTKASEVDIASLISLRTHGVRVPQSVRCCLQLQSRIAGKTVQVYSTSTKSLSEVSVQTTDGWCNLLLNRQQFYCTVYTVLYLQSDTSIDFWILGKPGGASSHMALTIDLRLRQVNTERQRRN